MPETLVYLGNSAVSLVAYAWNSCFDGQAWVRNIGDLGCGSADLSGLLVALDEAEVAMS